MARKQTDQDEAAEIEEAPSALDLVEDTDSARDPKPTVPMIAVVVAFVKGGRAVLEWRDSAGSLRRSWADAPMAEATEQALEGMEQYGEDLIVVAQSISWSRADVVEELHRMGVWRVEDVSADVLRDLYQGIARQAASQALQRTEEAKTLAKTNRR